jgi:hypothetical protein
VAIGIRHVEFQVGDRDWTQRESSCGRGLTPTRPWDSAGVMVAD